ncbi:hypothetical protein [Profundibacterium mesophilum]|uniref:Uncharacterized protein n=1 Tax=Profundibacterium mesophilum KAUST100406-0324 TaxID=1037889 RepID=A0A921NRB4_9RHOB|nr:hypothetical protein [Profundibacterium mesophilum]KAF0677167.1 hypothetical protein PMES_00483 [Profundibacterium mesophilum KAUST100406-0324]
MKLPLAAFLAILPTTILAAEAERLETVEIAGFSGGTAGDGTYVLRHDDAVTAPEALGAAITGTGYGAALVAGAGS